MWKQAVLQAGQELEQVAPLGKAKWRSLDAILTDQHHRPPTVNCRRHETDDFFICFGTMKRQDKHTDAAPTHLVDDSAGRQSPPEGLSWHSPSKH